MKYSKILTSSLLAISVFGIGCQKFDTVNQTGTNTSGLKQPSPIPSVAIDSSIAQTPLTPTGNSLGIIATPRPVSDIEDKSPDEPTPYVTPAPFIIGKPGTSFNSSNPSSEETGPIVSSKMSGKVYGFDTGSNSYKILQDATVSINGSTLKTDSSGNYLSSDSINTEVDLSASASGYYTSTVSNVRPGENRNIHLQPIDSRPVYNSNTISFDILSFAAEEPTNTSSLTSTSTTTTTTSTDKVTVPEVKYTSLLSFGDKNNSRFITKVVDNSKGRIRVEVNPLGNQSTATGQLFVYDVERDSSGRPTNPTQMKKFIYKKDVTFRVGDQYFPGTTPTGKESTTTSTSTTTETFDPIKNFSNINVKFNDSFGFNNFVCNAYAVFPTGEKVLVSRYTGSSATNLSFRVPKITGINLSYTIEAHAGNSSLGSDIVVNNLRENDSVDAYLLAPPASLSPSYDSLSTGLFPTFNWSANNEAKSFQVSLKNTDLTNPSAWEGYSSTNSIKYPLGLEGLKSGAQYNYQVLALDFNFGGLRVLSNKAEEIILRAVSQKNNDLPFKVQLASHESSTLPKGYRVSYNTVLFRAK